LKALKSFAVYKPADAAKGVYCSLAIHHLVVRGMFKLVQLQHYGV